MPKNQRTKTRPFDSQRSLVTDRMEIKIFDPANKKVLQRIRFRAPKGRVFIEEGINANLDKLSTILDDKLPSHHYRLVVIDKEHYNFVWDNNHILTGEAYAEFCAAFKGHNFTQDETPKEAEPESETNSNPTPETPEAEVSSPTE